MRAFIVIAVSLFASLAASASAPNTVDLHRYGFPSASDAQWDAKVTVFYLSDDRLALFFDKELPGTDPHSDTFQVIVLNREGEIIAQTTVHGDPHAIQITAGPGGGIVFGNSNQLDFYDSNLRLLRSMPEPVSAGVIFDRERNQLVITTVEREPTSPVQETQEPAGDPGHLKARFLDGTTLEASGTLTYPINSDATFGERELVYTVPGNCRRSAHFVSAQRSWRSLEKLPACDALTFITNDSLAYAFDGKLYVVDLNGKELVQVQIPAPDTPTMPSLVGLSDDHTRLAVSAPERWPDYYEIFVIDLVSKRMIFKHELPTGHVAGALSTDGHQLATIEHGKLVLTGIP